MSSNHNPRRLARKFKAHKPPASLPRILSNKQLGDILAAAENDPKMRDLHDVLVVISDTGIRSGEIQGLRWSDVDLENCHLLVNAGRTYPRQVPFGSKTLRALEERRQRQPETEFVLGKSPKGTYVRLSRQLRTLKELVGIECLSLHTFRRTFFARLMNGGASISSMMAIGGWKSVPAYENIKSFLNQRGKIVTEDQGRVEE